MMEQNQMETSNSGGTKISTLIIVFLLILLGVVVYFGFIEKPKETENPILNNQTEETNKPTTEETNKPITEEKPVVVETKKTVVIDGVDLKAEDHSYLRDLCKMYIKIPQILNGGENSVSLNQKMIGDIYQKSYCIPQNSNDYNSIEEYQQQARQVLRATYEYKILNNVVAIVTKLDREGINNQALSASYSFNYFYDLKNNTELEMYQALPLMVYTVADIKRLGANSFDDFKVLEGFKGEEPFRTYIEIQNNKIVITYKEEGAY